MRVSYDEIWVVLDDISLPGSQEVTHDKRTFKNSAIHHRVKDNTEVISATYGNQARAHIISIRQTTQLLPRQHTQGWLKHFMIGQANHQ